MTEFTPLDTTKPVSNEELAEAYNKLHNCVHDGFASVHERVDGLHNTMRGLLAGLGLRQQVQTAIDAGEPEKVKPKLAGVSRLQAAGWLFGAAGGAAALYRYVFPALEAMFTALHQALMAG